MTHNLLPGFTAEGAETLSTTKIQATPFISDYRIVAIVVCVILFIVEAVVDYFRITRTNARFSPIIVTIVFYVVVSATLTVCYIICAVSIMKRIKNMGSSRADRVKKMSLRFTLSSAGYVATIILEIITYIVSGIPWAPQICYNLLFASLAWTAMLQIWALKPFAPKTPSGTASKSDTGSQALHTV